MALGVIKPCFCKGQLTNFDVLKGHVNVAPRHLTAEAETLLSATLIHEVREVSSLYQKEIYNCVLYVDGFDVSQVMHVLGFDPHAFAHFRDERKRRRAQVI